MICQLNIKPILVALFSGIFTWGLTALGSAFIFLIKRLNQKVFDFMLGFAGGVMLSASFWSLLLPAVQLSSHLKKFVWFPANFGFLIGAIFLRLIDKILPHLHLGFSKKETEGPKTSWRSSVLLILAITLHNIPEGLAIGVTVGASFFNLADITTLSALALTIGIGIQDIPEGFAVSATLRREGLSRLKSFWYGQLSGIVEPIAAIVGAVFVLWAKKFLPYALGFAAGAMIFVVVEEVIPEAQRNNNTDLATTGTILGFILMMILDVAFS